MADKIERTYNVPLRSEWLKVPKYKRAKKAVVGLKKFISKHMKSGDVSIGRFANEAIWCRGMKSPPHHLKVTVLKQDNKVYVELFGKPIETGEKEKKKQSLAEKLGMKKKKQTATDDLQTTADLEKAKTTTTELKPKMKKAEIKEAEIVAETKAENQA